MAARLLYSELIRRRDVGEKERRNEEEGGGRQGGNTEGDVALTPPQSPCFWSVARRPCGIFLNPFNAFYISAVPFRDLHWPFQIFLIG